MPSNIHAVVAVSVLIQVGLSFITPSNSADPFLHWLFAHAIDAGRSIHYQNLQMLQDVQEQVLLEFRTLLK